MDSPKSFKVCAIILLSNGPHAMTLLVMCLLPRWLARTLERWCRPAFEELYANVSRDGTRRPSTDPMLMMREGESWPAFASRLGVRSWVIVKTRWRFRVRTRVHAASGYSSKLAPQLEPELLTRMSKWSSRFLNSSARRLQSSSL